MRAANLTDSPPRRHGLCGDWRSRALAGMAAALLACLLALPAQAQRPAAVANGVTEAESECRAAGGRPTLMPGFETETELNGDGQPDYLHDFSLLDCAGAASFFCGSAGCPLIAYLSTPSGYRSRGVGHVQGWTVDRSGPLPVLVLSTHGSGCGRAGAAPCERRIAWNGRDLAPVAAGRPTRPQQAAPAPTTPGPGTKDGAPAPAPAAARTPPAAWQVRPGGDGRPIAMVAGPGVVRALTVLCHEGVPVAALALRARPPAGPVTFALAGRSARASAPLRPGGGDVWFADLRGSGLARILSGGDSAVEVLINGGMQGRLSLQGSSQAVRMALAGCPVP